jgi:hypothetical protein
VFNAKSANFQLYHGENKLHFDLYGATFQQHLHVTYISLSFYDIPELVNDINISWIGAPVWSLLHTNKWTSEHSKYQEEYWLSVYISAAPACHVYISQFLRYSRTGEWYQYFLDGWLLLTRNRVGGVMVRMLASSAVCHGFELRSGQTKNYKISICCFSAKHAALRSSMASLLAWLLLGVQRQVSKFSAISWREQVTFRWCDICFVQD